MDIQKVDAFVMANGKYFRSEQIGLVRSMLQAAPETKQIVLMNGSFKNPVLAFVLSLLFGYLGIDRFYLGQIGLGVLKLITGGGCGIWMVVDWLLIMGATRDRNLKKLQERL